MKLRNKISTCLSLVLTAIICFNICAFALYGDLDGNGAFSTEDSRRALLFCAKIENPTEDDVEKADVNRDGYITTEDARLILEDAAGIKKITQHSYTPWVVTEKPNCKKEGTAICTCEECGKVFKKVLPKTEHEFVGRTCEHEGVCIHCGETIPPLGHKFVNGVCVRCHKGAPQIIYKNNLVYFGFTQKELIDLLGKPQETLREKMNNENVAILIYCDDYKNLGVFTFINNNLCEFYNNSPNTEIIDGKVKFKLNSYLNKDFNNLSIIVYKDEFSKNSSYSFSVSTGKHYYAHQKDGNPVCEKICFHVTNSLRAVNGQKPLIYSDKMHQTALEHSLDMADRNYFDHYTPEGISPFERMEKAGVQYHYAAENIACGPDTCSPYILCNLWYNSEGHRANMLSGELTHLGVGTIVSLDSNYYCYSTQNFYTPF